MSTLSRNYKELFFKKWDKRKENAMALTPKHKLVIYGHNDRGFIVASRTADDVSMLNKRVYIVPSVLSPRHYLTQRTSYSWIQACVHQITAWFSLLKLIKERQPSPIIKGLEYLRVQSKILQDCVWWRKGKNEWKALNYLEISEGFFFPLIALIIVPDTFLLPNYSLMHKPLFLF